MSTAESHMRALDQAVEYLALALHEGRAGLDQYDPHILVVSVASRDERDQAEQALDAAGATFLRDDRRSVRAELTPQVAALLGLDQPDPPVMVTPLASRSATSTHGRQA